MWTPVWTALESAPRLAAWPASARSTAGSPDCRGRAPSASPNDRRRDTSVSRSATDSCQGTKPQAARKCEWFMTAQCSSEALWVYLTTSRMLNESASAEKVEVQAKVEAKMRASDLCSTLTLTSAYLLDATLLGADARQTA